MWLSFCCTWLRLHCWLFSFATGFSATSKSFHKPNRSIKHHLHACIWLHLGKLPAVSKVRSSPSSHVNLNSHQQPQTEGLLCKTSWTHPTTFERKLPRVPHNSKTTLCCTHTSDQRVPQDLTMHSPLLSLAELSVVIDEVTLTLRWFLKAQLPL